MASEQPKHVTESMSDRKKSRELQEARQSGAVAPQVDVKTGSMINPHNPEFITKRPWYLGGNETGPSLDHQADQRQEKDKLELSLSTASYLVAQERNRIKDLKSGKSKFEVGMWVEALKNNRQPYKICQIIQIYGKKKKKKRAKSGDNVEFDLKYEDGQIERKVKLKSSSGRKPRIRVTQTGVRSMEVDAETYGKETFDSKRDKYHGYDTGDHNKKLERRFQERDAIRQKIRKSEREKGDSKKNDENNDATNKKIKDDAPSDSDLDSDAESNSDESDDEFAQRDEDARVMTTRLARQGGVGGAQMKVTARNLRIREDTAKYLRNLDVNSAYYDPKSRSMRDNPNPASNPEELQYAGDNFTRISGDAIGLADTQLFAWEASDKGIGNIHPQANPSQAELLKKQFKQKSNVLDVQKKQAVLEKYGGSEYLDGTDGLATAVHNKGDSDNNDNKERNAAAAAAVAAREERKARFGVNMTMEEYTQDGRVKGKDGGGSKQPRVALKSKYEEDVFINGHYSVWGSYFHKGAFTWGYADDHSLIKSSYCTGANGRRVNDEANEMKYGTGVAGSAALAQARGMLKAMAKTDNNNNAGSKKNVNFKLHSNSELYGEVDPTIALDQAKVQKALQQQEKMATSKEVATNDDRKRKYNSMKADDVNVTQEEMEAYRLSKGRSQDPMANFGSDEVLDYKK